MADETLIALGSALKALGDNRFGGYLVVFGDATQTDLQGEFFDANTDFSLDWDAGAKATVYFNHGADPVLKKRKLGRAELRKDDAGIWAEVILGERDEYEKAIAALAQKNVFGWSSGSAAHLIEREPRGDATYIKAWPIVEASITHTPAEWRTHVIPLKAMEGEFKALLLDSPPATPGALSEAGDGESAARKAAIQLTKDTPMTDETKQEQQAAPPANDAVKALEGRFDTFSATLNDFMKRVEESPALKNAGYVTQDGGAADPHIKSFGDFLKAVQRGDAKRLHAVYGSVKALNEDSGEAGGYLVPPEYSRELLKLAIEQSPALQRVRRVPVGSNTGKYPVLDNYITPTAGAGQTAGAAGLTTAKRAEGGAYTETDAGFEQLEWRINDAISGYVKVTKELSADSPEAIDALLRMLISTAEAAKLEYFIFHGNGVGEPLGILNAATAIGITPATNSLFAYKDALNMKARFKSVGGAGEWYIHKSMWPDIGIMENGTGGSVFQANLGAEIGSRLLGYSIHESEHLAQADASGCVVLTDLSAYLLFEKGGLEIEFSQHADFLNGNNVWRFSRRIDGQPWVRNPVTLAGPGAAYTVSPVVYFAD